MRTLRIIIGDCGQRNDPMSPWSRSSEIKLVLLSGEHGLREVSATHARIQSARPHLQNELR